MSKFVHYRGDTFELVASLSAVENGVPVTDLTGYLASSQIRDPKGGLIATLTAEWIDAASGILKLSAPSTTNWPLTIARMNVRITTPSGKLISSDSAFFEIEESPTQ